MYHPAAALHQGSLKADAVPRHAGRAGGAARGPQRALRAAPTSPAAAPPQPRAAAPKLPYRRIPDRSACAGPRADSAPASAIGRRPKPFEAEIRPNGPARRSSRMDTTATVPSLEYQMPDNRDTAPDHPPRRRGGDRQEHVRLRVRRRHRRRRLRAHVPRRGDVRDRPRHPGRHLPAREPREGPSLPDHPRPRRPRRRAAVRAAVLPGRARLRLDAGPRPAGHQDQGAQAPQQPAPAARPGRHAPDRAVPRRAVPDQPLDPGRDGHRPPHAGRNRRHHRRLQVRPHPGRWPALRLRRALATRRGRRHLPAVGLDARREPRLHALRADRRRDLPRDHGAARRPGHRGHLRQQHRPHPAGHRRGGHVRPQGRGHRPARWSRTSGSRRTWAT